MKKHLFIFISLALILLNSCISTKNDLKTPIMKSLIEEVNYSIVHDFYENDTIGKQIYLIGNFNN